MAAGDLASQIAKAPPGLDEAADVGADERVGILESLFCVNQNVRPSSG